MFSLLPSPPPPPAPSTRPNNLLSMIPGRSTSSLARQSLTRRPASASGVTYFRPRHRTADFESQTQRLRDIARARDLAEYAHTGPNSSSTSSSSSLRPCPSDSGPYANADPTSNRYLRSTSIAGYTSITVSTPRSANAAQITLSLGA